MFLRSIIGGIAALGHWQVLLGVALLAAGNYLSLVLVGAIVGRDFSGRRLASGWLTNAFVRPAFNTVLLAVLLAILIPLLLGAGPANSLTVVLRHVGVVAVAGLVSLIAIVGISLLPVAGKPSANFPGAATLCLVAMSICISCAAAALVRQSASTAPVVADRSLRITRKVSSRAGFARARLQRLP
jgi:hypothetical protein